VNLVNWMNNFTF